MQVHLVAWLLHWAAVPEVRAFKHAERYCSRINFQSPSGWLNDEAYSEHFAHVPGVVDPPVAQRLVERRGYSRLNMKPIVVTLSTRQSFSGWLNDEAPLNIAPIFVTLSTRQSLSGWLNDLASRTCCIHIRDIVDPPALMSWLKHVEAQWKSLLMAVTLLVFASRSAVG